MSYRTVLMTFVLILLQIQGPGAVNALAREAERFNRIEIWRLHVMWRCIHHDSQVRDHPASDTIEELTQKGELSGTVDFKLVKARDSNANFYQWETPDEEKPAGQIAFAAENMSKSKNKRTGKSSWFKMAANAAGIGDGGARLTIDARAATFRVGGYASSAQGQYEQSTSMGPAARAPMGINLSTGNGDWEGDLPRQGLTISGGTRQVTCNAPIVLAGRPMDVSWTLEPWKEEDLPEVWVEPPGDFVQWIPQGNWQQPDRPGNTVTVYIRVHEKGDRAKPAKAKLQFALPSTSEEKGVCLNWPAGAAKSRGLRLRQEDQEDPRIRVKDDTHAETSGEVEDVTVVVSAFDYGAWGTLQVSGQKDGQNLPVNVQGKATPDLIIPLDEDGNRIADAWEQKEGVQGYPATWDGAEVAGQTAKGDGLELYAKYRGLLVLEAGARIHKRLPPKEKCHFVIDPTDVFDFERWYRASGIRAYRIDDALARERRVDFNGPAARSGTGKYAVKLEMIPGIIEPDPWPGDANAGNNPYQYAYTAGSTPRDAERCRLFPDRVQGMIGRVISKMRNALDHPGAPENAGELAVLDSLGRPRAQIRARLETIDAAELKRLTQKMMVLSAIHEMGHACGVTGHLNAEGKEDEELGRSPRCPMNYLNQRERRLFILDGALGGDGRFCEAAPDQCWTQLNVTSEGPAE